jgi:aryl-alcohol dehydrogenase-like predicted oxidoreductase
MEYVTLGRTGLRASVVGLGAGGASRLGLGLGRTASEAVGLVRRALDLGVNLVDTAHAYQTEAVVGQALAGVRREAVIVSTKREVMEAGARLSGARMAAAVTDSLRRLRTDHVDLFLLHGVRPADYDYAVAELVPALARCREAGAVRFVGVSEAFHEDRRHGMLERALADGWCDAVMVGFNILNQTARRHVLPRAAALGVGVLGMYAVRRALSQPGHLRAVLDELARRGLVDPAIGAGGDPAAALLRDSGAESLTEAAYRYCRSEPGLHVVLTGTGDAAHLEANVRAALRPPPPPAWRARLTALFEQVDDVTGG